MGAVQIIRSPSGEEMVVLPRAEYEALLAAASPEEDADDVAIYDARKAALAGEAQGRLPAEVCALLLRSNSRLKAIRLWRNVSQVDLARLAGIGQGYLSDIENGRRSGSAEVLQTLARKLDVPRAWLD